MRRFIMLFTLLVASAQSSAAQGIARTTEIMGTVTDSSDKALAGATVEAVSAFSHRTRQVLTNSAGKFTMIFNNDGAEFRVTVRAASYAPGIRTSREIPVG